MNTQDVISILCAIASVAGALGTLISRINDRKKNKLKEKEYDLNDRKETFEEMRQIREALKQENVELKAEINKIKQDYDILDGKIKNLDEDMIILKIDNKKLEDQVKILQQENAELRAENIELNKLKSTLLLRIDKLIEENKEKTQAEVAEISNSDVLVESAEK